MADTISNKIINFIKEKFNINNVDESVSSSGKTSILRYRNLSADEKGKKASMDYDMLAAEHMLSMSDQVKNCLRDDNIKMSNAFPTYKLLIIEEDAEQWRNFDDFYGYNSVKSISIHKSRENAADTAVVEITNFKGVLDNVDFLAKTHADSAKETNNPRAEREQQPFEKMMIRPGTRVQIKLGYNTYLDDLDNTFTGKITSVEYGDVVTFVAQGYGVELLDDIGFSLWEEIMRITWWGPKQIINSLLKRGAVKHLGKWGFNYNQNASQRGWRIDDNPADDNVFVAEGDNWLNYSKWTQEFKVYHTSSWEAIQDIARRMPGYVASVVPFDDRATLFFGLPDQPYFFTAYNDPVLREQNYRETSESVKKESTYQWLHGENWGWWGGLAGAGIQKLIRDAARSKPGKNEVNVKMFRTYHFKDSSHHIVANNIKIDLENFSNIILVNFTKNLSESDKKKAGVPGFGTVRLPADDTIDPLYWKTKVVYEENCTREDEAYNYALSHLILSTQKLYDGELILLGDPRIKPHDIVFIQDDYTQMYGPVGVREVVHNFDREGGFTTTVVPDLVIHINNPMKILQTMAAGVMIYGVSGAISAAAAATPFFAPAQVLNPLASKLAFPAVYGRLGWTDAKREPIGVTPLVYAGKPYIAGFEGMKHEDWVSWILGKWKKGVTNIATGVKEAYHFTESTYGAINRKY